MATFGFWQLVYLLVLIQIGLVFTVNADCQENEFEDERGNCLPCKQCGPGQELSEDCGNGRDAQCVPCRPGRYKEDRGHQRCLRCLPCAVINRVLKVNCTPTMNSICGDCLPGFYSKTRIGGLQELECFPCTSNTPSTEPQCQSRPASLQPVSTVSPPRDPVILVAVIMVALALILIALVTFSVLCCGRFFKIQCQRAFQRSHNFAGHRRSVVESLETTQSPHEEQPIPQCCFRSPETCQQIQSPLEEESHAVSDKSSPSTRAKCNDLGDLQPSVDLCPLPPASIKPHYTRSVSETQPLIRNSGCSDCFSGCTPTSDSSQVVAEQLSTKTQSCASEQQHWSHAPVECTELDLQNFSSEVGFSASDHTVPKNSHGSLPGPSSHTCVNMDITQDGATSSTKIEQRSTCRHLSHQITTCQDLVSKLKNVTLGLHISQIPHSLVLSLGHQLDQFIPGQKNFKDLGISLGLSTQIINHMQGFEALHTHLSTRSSCTLLQMVQTLQDLARVDALSVICKHFGLQ
ncbi:tumor necrosis factor receptor superfamily member 27 [Pelobates fuscus]|uniref:tumor necrosis factor receptor superfamily member 27 n=1 Tax=Pelobates fuscus TaxID=191477 RepID=UPI002FE44004